jgi:hypothetical protein
VGVKALALFMGPGAERLRPQREIFGGRNSEQASAILSEDLELIEFSVHHVEQEVYRDSVFVRSNSFSRHAKLHSISPKAVVDGKGEAG